VSARNSPIRPPHSSGGSKARRPVLGAAFLMATSAVGPGFLTQTAVFTEQYLASFGFMILLTIVIDLAAQLNVWRIIGVSGLRGQDIANLVLPGLGYGVAFLVVLGGLAFNVGNVAGAGLGLNVVLGTDPRLAAAASALLAVGVFSYREIGRAIDAFTQVLGALMIVLVSYVAIVTQPPLGQVALRTVLPDRFDFLPVLTLVGGTVGGYITFAGGHRLIDAGITGSVNLRRISRSAASGILIASVVRVLLFLAVFGVVARGVALDPSNPPASAFAAGAGMLGYRLFGVVLWAAAITSVVGSAYTSVSFLRTLSVRIDRRFSRFVIGFIALSTLIFLTVGRPVRLLILAGSLNGLILPVTLGTVLLASRRSELLKGYVHPAWLTAAGYVVVIMGVVAGYASLQGMAELWK
jgi:Mn2+/Fe2+ NRAMP family transporter